MKKSYERYILPYLIDLACGIGPVEKQRAKVVPRAHGHVLEIGLGTGRNLPHYDPARLHTLKGLEPADHMHRLAAKRMREAGLTIDMLTLPAEDIPATDHSFDCVVCTYTLCTIPDPDQALSEMYRVLKPGGILLFSEHGRAPDAGTRRWQERLNPIWKPLAGGCNLHRPIPELIGRAGFALDDLSSAYLPGPKPMSYHYWGLARR